MKELPDGEWILWNSDDEMLSLELLDYIEKLEPKGELWFAINRLNLENGEFVAWANPDYQPMLVSNRVVYVGALHERIAPRNPHGIIPKVIIHQHNGRRPYHSGWKQTVAYRPVHAAKKALDIIQGR